MGHKSESSMNQNFILAPDGFTSTGRALFSPNTCVVNPKVVLSALKEDIETKGVKFLSSTRIEYVNACKSQLLLRFFNGEKNY